MPSMCSQGAAHQEPVEGGAGDGVGERERGEGGFALRLESIGQCFSGEGEEEESVPPVSRLRELKEEKRSALTIQLQRCEVRLPDSEAKGKWGRGREGRVDEGGGEFVCGSSNSTNVDIRRAPPSPPQLGETTSRHKFHWMSNGSGGLWLPESQPLLPVSSTPSRAHEAEACLSHFRLLSCSRTRPRSLYISIFWTSCLTFQCGRFISVK